MPCENCITLPICKAKLRWNGEQELPTLEGILKKCSLLREYIMKQNNETGMVTMIVDREHVGKAIKYIVSGEI